MERTIYSGIGLFLLLCYLSLPVFGQVEKLDDVVTSFNQIPDTPRSLYFKNSSIKIPLSGHLQGIQGYPGPDAEQLFITANSRKFSYYIDATAVPAKSWVRYGSTSLVKLLPAPYCHAGGCQLWNYSLFVGVEDSRQKNRSKIIVVHTAGPDSDRVQIIKERIGIYHRSTAGATGAIEIDSNKYFLVVGDWNSDNFDCYTYVPGKGCDSTSTFKLPDSVKKCSYQSVNLIGGKDGRLFMIATGRDAEKNRADLYQLIFKDKKITPVFMSTRYFNCTHGCNFRFGAGVTTFKNNIRIYATPRRLHMHNAINLFGPGEFEGL